MNKNTTQKRAYTRFDFHSLRNLSSPEDTTNNRKVYTGQAPLTSILNLPTNENVRTYLAEATGKQRKSYTSVHRAIKETLENYPSDFTVLNSGIVLVARDLVVEEKDKYVNILDPSIINGAQTQGVIKDLFTDKLPLDNVHIKFEIIVTDDEGLIAQVSIARNFQNNVLAVSIAGKLGQFNELEESIQKAYPQYTLRKSESEYPNGGDMLDTEKLLQVIAALVPQQLWRKSGESESPNKIYTFSMKARCLKEFQEIYNARKIGDVEAQELYNYYLEIAPHAWQLYKKWKAHQGFAGTGLRSIERNGREIVDVPDGIVFPIISSLSVFAEKVNGSWQLNIPAQVDKFLIDTAKRSYMDIADSNPQTMGKSKACYSSLLQTSTMYKSLS